VAEGVAVKLVKYLQRDKLGLTLKEVHFLRVRVVVLGNSTLQALHCLLILRGASGYRLFNTLLMQFCKLEGGATFA